MRSFKPTPAAVLSLLALIFAMTGTGLAAKSYLISSSSQIKDGVITGQDVKKSTITGTNIKDRSLTPADFNGSVTGPQGPQGAPGAAGAKGEKGDTGTRGPSDLYTGYRETASLPDNCSPPSCLVELGRLFLPGRGPYAAFANLWIENSTDAAQTYRCVLTAQHLIDEAYTTVPASGRATIGLAGAELADEETTSFGMSLACAGSSAGVVHDLDVGAIQVGALH